MTNVFRRSARFLIPLSFVLDFEFSCISFTYFLYVSEVFIIWGGGGGEGGKMGLLYYKFLGRFLLINSAYYSLSESEDL